jgi:acetaldehyde dehydrogenase (acetylating)
MNVFSATSSFAHHLSTFQLDDSSIALIALLVGMIGGYRIPGWHAQLKAKRAKISEKPQTMTRKID